MWGGSEELNCGSDIGAMIQRGGQIADRELPEPDGLYIDGGYPETLRAPARLADSQRLLTRIPWTNSSSEMLECERPSGGGHGRAVGTGWWRAQPRATWADSCRGPL